MNASNKGNIKMFVLPARFYFWFTFSLFFLIEIQPTYHKIQSFTVEKFFGHSQNGVTITTL